MGRAMGSVGDREMELVWDELEEEEMQMKKGL